MDKKIIEAAEKCERYRLYGYHCSESAIRAIAETLHIEVSESLLKASCGFRGGGGGYGGRCGILETGIMLISLIYGRIDSNESSENYSFLIRTLHERFLSKLGSCDCRDLQPYSKMNTPDGSCSIIYKKGTMIVTKLLLEADKLLAIHVGEDK